MKRKYDQEGNAPMSPTPMPDRIIPHDHDAIVPEDVLFLDDKIMQPFRLMELPPELLLQVASNLCGTEAIFSLSLVSKLLHEMAREAISKKLIVPQHRTKGAIEMLTRHPENLHKMRYLDLGDFTGTVPDDRDETLDEDAKRVLEAAMETNIGNLEDIQELDGARSYIWCARDRKILISFLALCPNITGLALELPEAQRIGRAPLHHNVPQPSTYPFVNPSCWPVTPLPGLVFDLIRGQLRSLTLREGAKWQGHKSLEVLYNPDDFNWRHCGKPTITLRGFKNLKQLDVSMDAIGMPQSIIFREDVDKKFGRMCVTIPWQTIEQDAKVRLPVKIFPCSLEHIQVRSCDDRTMDLL